jgi:hypothetical protein
VKARYKLALAQVWNLGNLTQSKPSIPSKKMEKEDRWKESRYLEILDNMNAEYA